MAVEAHVLRPEERDVPGGAAALAKGLYMLDVIGERDQPPRFKDLQLATGLPKGTLARILATLVAFRLVRHEESDNTYRLGNRLFELAHRVWESFDLRGAAAPQLERLAQETRETVALIASDNDSALYIDQRSQGGPFGFRIEAGRRAPLHCSAAGKALLAFSPPHEQRSVLARIPLDVFTSSTITDVELLQAELALSRARGYALSFGEHVEGVVSAAAPIFDHTGKAIAAIGVFGPNSRLTTDRLHVIGRDLMEAARLIAGNVGAAPVNNIHSKSPPVRSADTRVECVLPWGASLAEGPVWSVEERKLYWVDILAPAVHRFDPATGANETCPMPRLVSSVMERKGGGLAVTTTDGLEALDFQTRELKRLVDPESDLPDNRFNDAKCDANGRLWAGTMSLDAARKSGALYRINPDLKWTRMDQPFTVANGMDWSPDGTVMYFADSAAGMIFSYPFDQKTGQIGRKRVFARIEPDEGRPDGMAIDKDGCLWVALWDGWAVRRFDPAGRVMQDLRVPVPRPTSVAFGGKDLAILFITSARIRLPAKILADAPFSGGLFAADVGVSGRPAGQFAG